MAPSLFLFFIMTEYFILIDNKQLGPYTLDELRQRAISSSTLVWAEGMAQWTPAWQVPALRPLFNTAPASENPAPENTAPGSESPAGGLGSVGRCCAAAPENGAAESSAPESAAQAAPCAPPASPASPKKRRKALYIVLAVLAAMLFILALTNPSKAEHRQAILDKLDEAKAQIDSIQDPMTRTIAQVMMGAGGDLATEVTRELIDKDLEYHDYVFFSTTTLHTDLLPDDIRTSKGILGHVSAVSFNDIIPQIIMAQIRANGFGDSDSTIDNAVNGAQQASDATQGTSASDADRIISQVVSTVTQTIQDANGNTTTKSTKTVQHNGVTVDSLTKVVTNRLAGEISRHLTKENTSRLAQDVAGQVKQEIRQNTDSATAHGLNAIINDVLKFLGLR